MEKQKLSYYVYTDGSYRDGTYSGAFLVYAGTVCVYKDAGCGTKAASMQNVAGELSAVMHAAVWLAKNDKVGTIVYDYTGVEKWLTKEWKCKNEFTKAYFEFMKKYVDDGTVKFKWVKGHNGDLGNSLADKLAREALAKKCSWTSYADRKVSIS